MGINASVTWREQYTSDALNRKDYGVMPPGVYQGFDVTDNGDGTVMVSTFDSVAKVNTNQRSLTVYGDGDLEMFTPEIGTSSLCIQCHYEINMPTNVQFVLVAQPAEDGQIEIARITKDQDNNISIMTRPKIVLQKPGSGDAGRLSVDAGRLDGPYKGTNTVVDFGRL